MVVGLSCCRCTIRRMQSTQDIKEPSLPHAWADLLAEAKSSDWLEPEAHRLAFADPEFLLRRETRGIRFQLEMLKPDLAQAEAGIEHTVVVFGSARFVDRAAAQVQLQIAQQSGQAQGIAKAQALVRNAEHYQAVVAYIEENPEKAGLAKVRTEWPWSCVIVSFTRSSRRESALTSSSVVGFPVADDLSELTFAATSV